MKNWSGEDWVGGAPTVTMAPGTLAAWPALREPHDRVHFAGTETATQWIGWVVMMMMMMMMMIMMTSPLRHRLRTAWWRGTWRARPGGRAAQSGTSAVRMVTLST